MSRKKKKKQRLLLHDLACAINACEKNNISVKCEHGIIFSNAAVILPIKDRWVVRMLTKPGKR